MMGNDDIRFFTYEQLEHYSYGFRGTAIFPNRAELVELVLGQMKKEETVVINFTQSTYEIGNIMVDQTPVDEKFQTIKEHWSILVGEHNLKHLDFDGEGFSDWRCRRYVRNTDWELLQSRFNRKKDGKIDGGQLIYRPKTLNGIGDNNGWLSVADFSSEMLENDKYHKTLCWYMNSDRSPDIMEISNLISGGHVKWKPIEITESNLY